MTSRSIPSSLPWTPFSRANSPVARSSRYAARAARPTPRTTWSQGPCATTRSGYSSWLPALAPRSSLVQAGTQLALEYLAVGVARQSVDEGEAAGPLVTSEPGAAVGAELRPEAVGVPVVVDHD